MKLLASAYLMLEFYNTTNTQIPIVILKSETVQYISDQLANRTVQLITDYYNLDEYSERYLKIKVKPGNFHNGLPRELIVYRLHRERYLYETDRLFVDDNYSVTKEEKNIKV